MTGVHQVVAGAVHHDAITNHVMAARDIIRGMGLKSEVFAEAGRIDPRLSGQVHSHARWDDIADADDVAILHYSIDSPAFWYVLQRARRSALHYHNITPAELLWDDAPDIARACADGRARLGELLPRVHAMAADSAFNAEELERMGFRGASVVGILRTPLPRAERSRARGDDCRLLFVGRGVPNKAQHHLVLVLAASLQAGVDATLALVGSWDAAPVYRERCERTAERIGVSERILWHERVDDLTLAQCYADADIFVCASDHEGFCVPVLEAMEAELPIVAYAAAAVPETVGTAGVLLPSKAPSLFGEAIAQVHGDACLRDALASGRQHELQRLEYPAVATRLRAFVAGLG